jgi:hypothetical protein
MWPYRHCNCLYVALFLRFPRAYPANKTIKLVCIFDTKSVWHQGSYYKRKLCFYKQLAGAGDSNVMTWLFTAAELLANREGFFF